MSELTQVLRRLLPVEDPNALVDASSGDDAAVYRISDDRALVVSLDFFTPIVDDPYDFGRIGAANALSDIYAMGARPLFGLNLVGFPRTLLGEGLLEEIIAGGAATCREAGIPVLGGHSIDDPEPKFGMVAVGEVRIADLVTNAAARPGDKLVLTKPLGSGIVATAIKADAAAADVVAGAVEVMTTLNDRAARAMLAAGVKAATDVTGFGLLGHLRSLLRSSGAAAVIEAGAVPLLPGAFELAEAGHIPGGTKRNLEDLEGDLSWGSGVGRALRTVLVDAQTSGGLLMAVPAAVLESLLAGLAAEKISAALVGEVTEGRPGAITVR
jgi:selenide,water dikinase